MPIYVGYSSQNANQSRSFVRTGIDGGIGSITTPPRLGKKYRLLDANLVIQDFVNAFNIKQGDKVGNPSYGTTIWSYVFEPNTQDTRMSIETEVRRVANLDPRILLNTVAVYEEANGVLIEVEMAVTPFNNAIQTGVYLNKSTSTATQLG